jgi:surface carbohydrate biosynthesis protein
MKRTKTKVLCFTDNATGRDVEMLLPIRYFAERFLNCEFFHALNIDVHQIYRYKPDVILQANTIGSNLYFEISNIAHEQNIPLFALISEGNFRLDGSFDYWGYNRDKKFYQDYVCCWSERTAEFLKIKEPEAAEKIVVTGGTSFDRYTIFKFMQREEFLRKYNKQNYKKVIGYAGWAFGKLDHKRGREELLIWVRGDENKLKWIEEQRRGVENILREIIKKNRDTLFVLKQHPQENAPERPEPVKNEMRDLAQYENVIYLCEEEAIHDLISVSDIWTCFESTTALEGWLMGKQTIFINPDPNFNRDPVYKGSALIQSSNELQRSIDEYYSTCKIERFFDPEKASTRKELIKDIIGFGDGMNHIRASNYFQKTIERSQDSRLKSQYLFHFWHWLVYVLLRTAGPFYNRTLYSRLYKLKKHLWVFENYRMEKLYQLYQKYTPFFSEFYEKYRIEEKFKDGSLVEKLK